MNHNVLSGVQMRKRAEQENGKMSKLPKLTSWFNPGATSATNTAPSNIASTSISTPASNHPGPVDIPMVSLLVPAAGDIPQEEIPKSVTVKEFAIQDTDLGLWNINNTNTVDYWIHSGLSSLQNYDSNLSNSCRVYKGAGGDNTQTRYLSNNMFKNMNCRMGSV